MAVQENCCNSRKTFWGILGLAQVCGLLAISLLVMWNVAFNMGYQWGHGNQQFSIHPLVMIIGMVYLYGDGAVVFRVLECIGRFQAKIVHMVIMSIILILSVFGVYTVFNYHAMMNYGNMYTMHSWCGMMNVVAFGLQFFVGFTILLWPGAKGKIRNIYMPIHRYSSFGIMAITVGSIASGVVEDLLLCIDNREYRELPLHAVIFNVVGVLCIVYILLIMYLTYRDDWKRGTKLIPAEGAEDDPKVDTKQSASGSGSGSGETDKLLPK